MSDLTSTLIEILKESGRNDEILRRQLLDVLSETAPQNRMTYEEFLSWVDEDTSAEWVDGKVIINTPANDRHQDISGFITSVLRVYVEAHHLGIVRSAPFQMKLSTSGREPDLVFVAKHNLERLRATHLQGPADMVIEIISPESVGRDRGEKFYEYEQAGIPEYWLIDPDRKRAEFYQLDNDGLYKLIIGDQEGTYKSKVLPGLEISVDWFWEIPPVIEALRALELI